MMASAIDCFRCEAKFKYVIPTTDIRVKNHEERLNADHTFGYCRSGKFIVENI